MAQSLDQGDLSANKNISLLLERVSNKANVKATIVLDRTRGSVLQTAGRISTYPVHSTTEEWRSHRNNSIDINSTSERQRGEKEEVEELAAVAWNFVNAAQGLVQGLDAEDDVRLLRLRTKKHELLIVPDAKYILIAVHETPAA